MPDVKNSLRPPSPVVIHQLHAADRAAVERFLVGLDPESRSSRFGGALSDDAIRRYAADAVGRGILFGAFAEGRLCALAELCPDLGDRRATEAAFAVAPGQRRRGIGAALLDGMVVAAANRGFRTMRIMFSPENGAMRRLALHGRAKIRGVSDQVWADITLPAPTPISFQREVLAEWFGWLGHALQQPWPWRKPQRV